MATSNTTTAVFNSSLFSRVRRNHGLEHATLQMLAKRMPGQPMAGYSYTGGFWLIGDVPTETLHSAVEEALDRLRGGEHDLAVHPGCGTNYLAAGLLAGLGGGLAMIGAGNRKSEKVERMPLVVALATIGVIFSQPLGRLLQERVTTDGVPGNLHVTEIMRYEQGSMVIHRVRTRD